MNTIYLPYDTTLIEIVENAKKAGGEIQVRRGELYFVSKKCVMRIALIPKVLH
jgi:hypothetical protein